MIAPEPPPEHPKLGPYQLGTLLGEGGMGKVFKAFDDRLGRWVAVKRLHGEATPASRDRFRREARTLAQLGHPAIVQVFDLVTDEQGDWLVMELVDGPTLAELCRAGPLDVGLALDYGRQIASALHAAHTRGIVHRDLKTENVMVLTSGHVKVLDFGLARRVASGASETPGHDRSPGTLDAGLSRPGRIVGTPRAMSPEQARGRAVDARSDLFSFGVLLYEITTARSPFVAGSFEETLIRVLSHQPPAAFQLHPKVPRALSELIDRLLAKEPTRRPQTAAGVEAELAAIAAGDPLLWVGSRTLSQETLPRSTEPGDPAREAAARDEAVVTTLLVSDLVGSTELVEKLGDRGAAALFRHHDRLARDLCEQHGGREIDKTDGFLLLFDRPWNAVSYALAYHARLCELALSARVGIHLGEVILHRNTPNDVIRGAKPVEVEGLAKPTAARLMSLAAGGQTLLTRAAWEVARRSAASEAGQELVWESHGCYRFQGIGDEIEVFEVGVPGQAPLAAPAGSAKVRRLETAERTVARPISVATAVPPSTPASQPVTLRSWPPPPLPEQPYPVLLPYTHPDFLAGRDQEIARLRRLLEMRVPVLGLSAPSGTGKSSLLLGGLAPTLRAAGVPVALVRHPAEAGVAARLIGDLLDGAPVVDDGDAEAFVARLAEVERLAGKTPVLVLDQIEDVLHEEAAGARGALGVLMAASVAWRPGLGAPACRWLLVCRQEHFGRLCLWLGDVLAEARSTGTASAEGLPHDLSRPERFHGTTLSPLAKPSPGAADPLAESMAVFLAAIEKPLASEGAKSFPWHFPPGHAERLARAFAEARLARPEAPLAPELQVVLAHLLAHAEADGRLEVPDDPGPLIDQALDDHLRRALETAFPSDDAATATRRARALLALRELAGTTGEREEGLRPDQLARAIGEDGETILERLATPLTRLVVLRETPGGRRWVLAHDRMAEAVVRLVEEEGRRGQLVIDTELLALRRLVTLRTALHQAGETRPATRLPRRLFRRIAEHSRALLWDEERRAWWAACQEQRRRERRRAGGLVAVAMLVLALVGWGAWSWAQRLAEQRALREQVARGEPGAALRALDQLATRPDADPGELLALLRRRQVPMDVLERGLSGLDGPERGGAVLRAAEIALPWVEQTPQDPVLLANLVWALDLAPGRDPLFAERARALRDQALEPLRRLRPPPPPPEPDDPDWIEVVSAFRMQRHEVTNAEYRRLVPGHDPSGGDDLPVDSITWYAAYAYAAWLGGRLPTEAEWEVAARAGCPHDYCARDGRETALDAVAWTERNALDAATGERTRRPVMRLEPNPWGLYDMLGNVWEGTADWFEAPGDSAPGASQGQAAGVVSGTLRAMRGGSFGLGEGAEVLVTLRAGWPPDFANYGLGFRVVLDLATPPPESPPADR